jgi:dihydropteroate synthase
VSVNVLKDRLLNLSRGIDPLIPQAYTPRAQIMGILNITPDSVYDGGQYTTLTAALQRAEIMVAEGVDIIDVGGESTRPGAVAPSIDEECARVIPVIKALRDLTDLPLSVDTSQPQVMREAVLGGATLINDQRALRLPGALEVAADSHASICLMHMQGNPSNMKFAMDYKTEVPEYTDVVADVLAFLTLRVDACLQAGILREKIIVDPGICFGKNTEQNLQLLKHLGVFKQLELPLLIGVSRKSLIGHVLKREMPERLVGGLALAAFAILQGASIIRTHDVKETVDVVNMLEAVVNAA